MSFSILVSKKLLHFHEFLRFLPCGSYETIKDYLYTFLLMSLCFPIQTALHPFSRFFQVTSSKTLKIYLFGNVILFLHIGCFTSDLAIFYVKYFKDTFSAILFCIPIQSESYIIYRFAAQHAEKNSKAMFLVKSFNFPILVAFHALQGLVHNSPKKKQK